MTDNPTPEEPRPRFLLAKSLPVVIIRHIVEFLTALGVAVYSTLICIQVFYRYFLNSSLAWSEEIVQFLLLWTVMLSSAMATDKGLHITLNPLEAYFGERGRRALGRIGLLGTVAFCLPLAWYGYQLMERTLRMTSPAADLPMWWVYSSLPVGALLITFFAVVHIIDGTDLRFDPMDDRM
jgi:TRAP-type C4-dicarboxylate transport system permease small subunit